MSMYVPQLCLAASEGCIALQASVHVCVSFVQAGQSCTIDIYTAYN